MTHKHFLEALGSLETRKRIKNLCLSCGERAGELIGEQDDEFLIDYVDEYLPQLTVEELEGVAEQLGRLDA